MKRLYLFSFIVIILCLAFCKEGNTDAGNARKELAETLAGNPKPQGQWGAAVPNIPNNIGVTFTGSPETSRTITWMSNLQSGEVIIGDERYASSATASGGYYFHRVDVTDLAAGTKYNFIVGATAGETEYYSPLYSFTAKSAGDSGDFKIIHVTDPQIGSDKNSSDAAVWKRVLEAAEKKCPDAAFIVNTGDIVENLKEAVISYYFDYAQDKLAVYPFFYSMGNNDDTSWYNKYFYAPANENAEWNGLLYSFDYGNVHFINVDSNINLSGEQLEWLENDLKNTAKKWKVVMTHEADYGRDGNDTDKTKLFDKYNVDLVMAGHNHFYARTKPINTAGANKAGGTVWSIPNAAGTKFNSTSGKNFLAVDKQPNLPMFSIFRFTDTNIELEAYTVNANGATTKFDSYKWR